MVEPNYTVSVKWLLPGPFVLLDMLQPVDGRNRWLLRDFPTDYLYEPFREGVSAFSGSVKNQHLLYALFHILTTQASSSSERACSVSAMTDMPQSKGDGLSSNEQSQVFHAR